MKSKLNIKSILIIAIIGIFSLVFLNKSFAAVTGKVNVDVANIRQSTDGNSTILEQAVKGEDVQIIERSGDWYKVKYKGVQGYIKASLLQVSEEVATVDNETNSNENITQEENVEQTTNETTENTSTQSVDQIAENIDKETATENQINSTKPEGMYITKDSVKLKLIPLVNGNDIKEINKDVTINVLEVYNKWALVEIGLDRGWVLFSKIEKVDENTQNPEVEVKQEQEAKQEEPKQEEKQQENTEVTVAEKTMYINSDVVNLRQSPTTTSASLAKLTKATQVTVFAKADDWSKVKVNGKEGYIKSSLLTDRKPEVTTSRNMEQPRQDATNTTQAQQTQQTAQETTQQVTETPQTSSGSDLGNQVCNFARKYIGCKYVYGGTSPTGGFDCSGFTQYVFKNFGVTLNRTAQAQASNGTYVAKSNLKAGDLLIFTNHAGIYLGDGTFIHAANPSSGVIITPLSSSYYVKNYITARRIFN